MTREKACMSGIDIFEHNLWQPFAMFGLTGPLFTLNGTTIATTWYCMLIIAAVALAARYALQNPDTLPGFIVTSFIRTFTSMVHQTFDKVIYRYYAFITTLFIFIIVCNCCVILGFHEPTTDPNTTFALGIISFLYAQKEAILSQGLWGYIKHYFKPFFFMAPLEVLGKLTSIISLSFRLFGNIFGGSLILTLWAKAKAGSIITQTLGLLLGINLITMLFFGLFEGFIQAFVFTVLSLTYISMGIQEEHT